MAYVYVLKSLKDGERYIGSTNDLPRRIDEHNSGKVFSTKNRRPLILYAFQECDALCESRQQESKYKRSRGAYEKAIKSRILKLVGE